MSCIIDELVVGMLKKLDDSEAKPMGLAQDISATAIGQDLFIYADNHKDYFQSIMTNPQLIQQLSATFYRNYLNKFESDYFNDTHLNVNKGFYICYFTSVTIGVIYHWLMNTEKKYSAEYAANEVSKFINL